MKIPGDDVVVDEEDPVLDAVVDVVGGGTTDVVVVVRGVDVGAVEGLDTEHATSRIPAAATATATAAGLRRTERRSGRRGRRRPPSALMDAHRTGEIHAGPGWRKPREGGPTARSIRGAASTVGPR